jgi:NitT/TauT family transport system permease protein
VDQPTIDIEGHARKPTRRPAWWRQRSYLLLSAALVATLFLVWQWLTTSEIIHRIVVPAPATVFGRLGEIVTEDYFRHHLWVTVQEVIVGFSVGALSGVAIALLCVRYAAVRRLLTPYIVTLQSLPKIILLPLLYLWLGVGQASATVIVLLVAFFPVYISTLTGLESADPSSLRLLYSLGATPRQAFRMYRIQAALPMLFTGLKTAVNFSVAAAITSELLGARYGLGFMIANSATFLRIDDLYAAVVVVSIFAGLVYTLFEVLDRKLIFWRDREVRDEGGDE